MPIVLNASSDAPQVATLFRDYADKFPKDLATALSRTASKAKAELVSVLPDYIDRPTPFTKRGFYSRSASAKSLQAEVGTKDATEFYRKHHSLKAQIFGGDRALKGSERRLRATGLLAGNEVLAPGPAVHLDQYGNVPGQTMVKLLSQIRNLSIAGESGFDANRAKGVRSMAFFGVINGTKGIWQRRGKRNIRLMMVATKMPDYTPRFPMVEIVRQFFERTIEGEFWKAYDEGKQIRARKGLS